MFGLAKLAALLFLVLLFFVRAVASLADVCLLVAYVCVGECCFVRVRFMCSGFTLLCLLLLLPLRLLFLLLRLCLLLLLLLIL